MEQFLARIELFRKDRQSAEEPFKAFATRVGVEYWKQALEEFTTLPPMTPPLRPTATGGGD